MFSWFSVAAGNANMSKIMTKEKPTKPNKNRPDGHEKTDKTSKDRVDLGCSLSVGHCVHFLTSGL